MQQYIESLNECQMSRCQQRDALEQEQRLFTNAILYQIHIYPRVEAFLRDVRFLMVTINQIGKVEQFKLHIDKLENDCEKLQTEAVALESDHNFAVGRFQSLSNILDKCVRELNAVLHTLEEREVLGKVADVIYRTSAASLRREEASLLKNAAASISKLRDCCQRIEYLVSSIRKMVTRVGSKINLVPGFLQNATKDAQDEIIYTYLNWAREAGSLVPKETCLDTQKRAWDALKAFQMGHPFDEVECSGWKNKLRTQRHDLLLSASGVDTGN